MEPDFGDEPMEAAMDSVEPAKDAGGGKGGGGGGGGAYASSGNPRRNYTRKLSVSEEATLASSKRFQPPDRLRRFIEWPFRTKNPTHGAYVEEVTAWGMDAAGRGPLNQAGSYLGVAIITLATIDAGCKRPATCENKVYGLDVSSLLPMASVITGIACAILMPIMGAIVDHTSHRKAVGILTAFLICAVTAYQITISLDTWFVAWVLEIISGFSMIMHFTSVMAYLPDLSEVEYELTHYTSRFNIVMYMTQLVYVVFLISMTYGLGLNSIQTAKVALAGAFTIGSVFFAYSWTYLFRKRPALSQVPPDSYLITSGFKQLYKTSRKIFKHYHALRWFMIALLWSPEAGAGVVLSIMVTYLTVIIEMKAIEVGIVNLILLVFTVPGSLFSIWFSTRFNPLNSFRWGLVYLTFTLVLTIVLLDGPDRKYWTFGFGVLWGLAFGWVFPSQRTLQVTLTPRGQETEMMGLFAFCTQVVGWLPALIFLILNQNGVDMRWGISVIPFELCISIFFLLLVGDYDEAVQQVQDVAAREAAEAAEAEAGAGKVGERVDERLSYGEGHMLEDGGVEEEEEEEEDGFR